MGTIRLRSLEMMVPSSSPVKSYSKVVVWPMAVIGEKRMSRKWSNHRFG